MKGVTITIDDYIDIEDFDEPLYKSIGDRVGGFIEIVRLPAHDFSNNKQYCMVVCDEGVLRGFPVNRIASVLYSDFIVGNAVIMKEGYVNGEPDLVGLDEDDIDIIVDDCFTILEFLKS